MGFELLSKLLTSVLAYFLLPKFRPLFLDWPELELYLLELCLLELLFSFDLGSFEWNYFSIVLLYREAELIRNSRWL